MSKGLHSLHLGIVDIRIEAVAGIVVPSSSVFTPEESRSLERLEPLRLTVPDIHIIIPYNGESNGKENGK